VTTYGETPRGLSKLDWALLVVALILLFPFVSQSLQIWYSFFSELLCPP
jgi:hypothetical protein